MAITSTKNNNLSAAEVETYIAAAKMSQTTPLALSPGSAASQSNFFPSSQPTPDHANANAMLAARKQQLAHLQTLQRQQQQVLQQMSHRSAAVSTSVEATALSGYAQDGRDDRFSASGLRSQPSPVGSQTGTAVGAGSVVSFNQNQFVRSASPRRPAFECDYDTNPTELYLSVQRKDWDGAVERSATCPHEASTWVSRKEADGKLRWRLLPLHAAIIFRAPERAISALLFAFAQGAACKDDQGMLPLHLAFRNGCDEGVIHLLLMAYPQSVDVQDRKGRTPMVLAQQSTHANRELYIRALEKGPAYYAVANAAKDGIVNSPGAPMQPVPAMPGTASDYNQSQSIIASLQQHQAAAIGRDAGSSDRINSLEAELAKTQETSQVLVDHVNSLEAQLASRSDTERFLATKIANLDSQLKESNVKLEASAAEIEAKKVELSKKEEEVDERVKAAEDEVATLKVALADKKEAELKSYKLTNKERFDLEERVETSERECAAAQANAAVLEAQLKKKIETEQSLASQVSMLASQLASSASASSESASAYQRKCESLTADNKKLQAHIEELEGKLGTVATALDAMAAEQERIVEAATKHEKTMASCAKAHQTIVQDTTRQETLLEDAAKEREQIVSILMRQAEDAERTMADREKVLEAVKEQEKDIVTAVEERDAVVDSVNKQRDYMDFMLNGELKFLKRTDSEDACNIVNEQKKDDMDRMMQTYLNERPQEVEQMQLAKAAEDAAVPEVGVPDQAAVVAAAFEEEEKGDSPAVEEEETQVEEDEKPSAAVDQEEESAVEEPQVVTGEEEAATEKVEVEEKVEEKNEKVEDEDTSEEDAEDAALEEAANAVKEAMKAAENAIVQDGEDDDDSDDDDVDDESYVGNVSVASAADEAEADDSDSNEEEESPADAGYETPASHEEDKEEDEKEEAAIDAAVSAASSNEDSVDSRHE